MTEERRKKIGELISILDFRCECLSTSFSVRDDKSIICHNCKREFDIIFKEQKPE